MYTDPDDQGIWMYHRWLVGSDGNKDIIEREIWSIQELLNEQPDSKSKLVYTIEEFVY